MTGRAPPGSDAGMGSLPQFPLLGLRILLAEDDYLIADDVARMLERRGADVVGPVSTVADASRLAVSAALDGAVLDVNLRGDMVWPVADMLRARHVPTVFLTGYGVASCPDRYGDLPWLSKPILMSELVASLSRGIPLAERQSRADSGTRLHAAPYRPAITPTERIAMDGDAHGDQIHEIYHTGLRNMHALEMTAIELCERQVERLETYPEMKARLQQHHKESQVQAHRLEGILARHQTSSSTLKNTVTSVMGNVAAALHAPAPDEVLKNTFANFAFEHEEIAAYTSLIAMAETVGDQQSLPLLKQSLGEEQSMADFIKGQIVPTTKRFLELTRAGKKAGV
jgi:ferritin-like metal-binding protein YciE/ActR/RegA family two-component response regulator